MQWPWSFKTGQLIPLSGKKYPWRRAFFSSPGRGDTGEKTPVSFSKSTSCPAVKHLSIASTSLINKTTVTNTPRSPGCLAAPVAFTGPHCQARRHAHYRVILGRCQEDDRGSAREQGGIHGWAAGGGGNGGPIMSVLNRGNMTINSWGSIKLANMGAVCDWGQHRYFYKNWSDRSS